MSCIQCKSVAFHEEESNPKNTFCGDRCQQRYYGLIGVQIERIDEDEEDADIYPFFSYIGTFAIGGGDAHKLYLGSMPKEDHVQYIRGANIKTVISLSTKPTSNVVPAKNYKKFEFSDEMPSEKTLVAIGNKFKLAATEISEGLKTGNVLIHCDVGQSRSPSVVIYWLVSNHIMDSIAEALQYVRAHRSNVNINILYFRNLLESLLPQATEPRTKRQTRTHFPVAMQ